MKKVYTAPALAKLGLVRVRTRFTQQTGTTTGTQQFN
jgi:hypothetical protein